MDRRDFLKGAAATGSASSLGLGGALTLAADGGVASRSAFRELLETLALAEEQYLSPEAGIERPADIADGERYLMHVLETGLYHWLEADPDRPVFKKYVTPSRKLLGDNPDSLYYFAPIQDGRSYLVRGNLAGATFTSFTIEKDGTEGRRASGSLAAIDDTQMAVDADGNFELLIGPDKQPGNWLPSTGGASQITTRHYFERVRSIARDESAAIPLTIEALDPPRALPTRTDTDIAQRIGWVANFVRAMTIGMPLNGPIAAPWVSRQPNTFKQPSTWDGAGSGYGNLHAAYAMAPYVVLPDQALIIEGRFPPCKFANVVLWNRFLQAYDFRLRSVSLNRAQTKQDGDGRFKMVIAHSDPGVPNWLDASGRVAGLVYWRFLFAEGDIETPTTQVVPVAEVAAVIG